MATGAVAVSGLRELERAFNRFDEDLTGDLVMELQEAADPVAKLTERYILGGGGGFSAISGVASSVDRRYWSGMRIGVSRRAGEVYVAPAWRSNKGTLQGAILAVHERFRMEGALEDKSDEVEKRLGDWLDRMSNEWGRGA